MDKWNLIVDVARCNNCAACTLAVMDEHAGNTFPGYAAPQPRQGAPWIDVRRQIRGEGEHVDVAYMPTMCNHCDRPPCAEGSEGAVIKRADGIVLIDPEKARGRRDIVARCPYGAIHWNEEQQLPQIWIFDAHLLDAGWTAPRCQQACATGALRAVKVSDARMQEIARDEGLETLRPDLGTLPRVHYRNLHRMNRRFIAGTVHWIHGGIADCLKGCEVALTRAGAPVASTRTDWFGDFSFDHLPDAAMDYELRFAHPDCSSGHAAARTELPGTEVGVVALEARAAGSGS